LRGLAIDLSNCHATPEQINRLIYYVCVLPPGREHLFSPDNIPGRVDTFRVNVDIINTAPWQSRLMPCSPADKVEIEKLIQEYLLQGLIEPGHGPYASPILLVRKPSGRHKIAVCLNQLNARSRKNSYPVPLIRDCLDFLSGREWLSAIDICGGYLSMVLDEADRDYFGFISHFGLYRWCRAPYGWVNSGANFCYCIDQVLAGLRWQILVQYIDDSMIGHGETFEEHLRALNVVFDRLQKWGLRLSVAKCSFFMKTFEYLGFTISRAGVSPSPKNVEKLFACSIESSADVRKFLGMAQFYRRWVEHFSLLAAPLYECLKVPWPSRDAPTVEKCVATIKGVLTSTPILQHPDFQKPFFLATDGSQLGYGSVLQQMDEKGKLYVIAYASSGILPAHKNLLGPQLEAAAACWGMVYFRHYLLGRQFTLLTDQVVMKYLRTRAAPIGPLAGFILESQEFQYIVKHIPGAEHTPADFLSRVSARDHGPDLDTIARQELVYMSLKASLTSLQREVSPDHNFCRQDWIEGQLGDSKISSLRTILLSNPGSPTVAYYKMINDLVH
jgi:hypothetical protein